MKDCVKIEMQLAQYLDGLLNVKARESIDQHIQTCSNCKRKLHKMSKIFNTVPEDTPSDNFNTIYREFKKREKNKQNISIENSIQLLRVVFKNKISWVLTGLILIIGILTYYYNSVPKDYLYITNASGQVKINHKTLINSQKYKYDLKKKISIQVFDGKCVFQINNKQIILKKKTYIEVNSSSSINIQLNKGLLIGRIEKGKDQKQLLIKANNTLFHIIGTTFFIRNYDEKLEMGVKEGSVKCSIKEKDLYVQNDSKITIKKDQYTQSKITKGEKRLIKEIHNYDLISDFKNINRKFISVYPLQSDIYVKSEYFGKSPVFFLYKTEKSDIIIRKKGYQSHKLKSIENINDEPIILSKSFLYITNKVWYGEADSDGSFISVSNQSFLKGKKCTTAVYDFKYGIWIQINCYASINIEDWNYLVFDYINTNPYNNQLSVKLSDRDGSFFGYKVTEALYPNRWQKVSIPIDKLKYLFWGEDQILDREKIKKIFISLEKKEGGKGKIGIRNVMFK